MRRLRLILILSLSATVLAVSVAAWNLVALYRHEKSQTLRIVRDCAENAFLLEMIGRMQRGEEATESFICLNYVIAMAQQKNGLPANSDTLRTSLASILRYGLEFADNEQQPGRKGLDSIFRAELLRHGLDARKAYIRDSDSTSEESGDMWTTSYGISPSSNKEYKVYVYPQYKSALNHMWGIIIPFSALILIFSFLSFSLTGIIKRMRTLEQMKDDFTHNMTHELKTPVAVAYSAADSMLRYYDQSDEARNKQFLKIIMRRLSHLSGMIENILSMSMERFKTMKLNIENVALRPIVDDVASMIRLKADKPTDIEIDVPDNLSVQADPLHLGNILSNLLDNALKYSGDSVNIKIKADAKSISISDNGVGIDKGDLPFIFDKFYRVASGDRYEVGGYGLGLYYVRQICDLMSWDIEVRSKLGQGTMFKIRFDGNEKG